MLKSKTERIAFFFGVVIAGAFGMLVLFLRDRSTPLLELTFENRTSEACTVSSLNTSDGHGWRVVAEVSEGSTVNVRPWNEAVFQSQLVMKIQCSSEDVILAFEVPQVKAMQLHGGRAIFRKSAEGISIDFTGSDLLLEKDFQGDGE